MLHQDAPQSADMPVLLELYEAIYQDSRESADMPIALRHRLPSSPPKAAFGHSSGCAARGVCRCRSLECFCLNHELRMNDPACTPGCGRLQAPSGAAVFAVGADLEYQEAMLESLAAVATAAHADRPLTAPEAARAGRVRTWSHQLAMDARLLTTIDAQRCVVVQQEVTLWSHTVRTCTWRR